MDGENYKAGHSPIVIDEQYIKNALLYIRYSCSYLSRKPTPTPPLSNPASLSCSATQTLKPSKYQLTGGNLINEAERLLHTDRSIRLEKFANADTASPAASSHLSPQSWAHRPEAGQLDPPGLGSNINSSVFKAGYQFLPDQHINLLSTIIGGRDTCLFLHTPDEPSVTKQHHQIDNSCALSTAFHVPESSRGKRLIDTSLSHLQRPLSTPSPTTSPAFSSHFSASASPRISKHQLG
jgi:hypothetical protein